MSIAAGRMLCITAACLSLLLSAEATMSLAAAPADAFKALCSHVDIAKIILSW